MSGIVVTLQATDPALDLLDKPAGWTSRKTGAEVARQLGVRKLGHLGTLDPFATGLLPLCVGRGTRLSFFLDQSPKVYAAELQLGVATDTGDCDGTASLPQSIAPFSDAQLIARCDQLTGEIQQVPPNFSAVKVAGRRAFKRARAGEDFVLPARPVTVFAFEATRLGADRLALKVACGPGVYIRRLGEDLARFLGTTGHLVSLRRLSAGPLRVDKAAAPDELGAASIWTTAQLLAALGESVRLDALAARWVRDGKDLSALAELAGLTDGRYGIFCDSEPVALVAREEGIWRILRGIPQAGAS